jgi:hypothetical protein
MAGSTRLARRCGGSSEADDVGDTCMAQCLGGGAQGGTGGDDVVDE